MTTFFAMVPVWVAPLFLLLLAMGLRATRRRMTPLAVIGAMPLLGLLSLQNIASLSPSAWIWGVAAAVYVVDALMGRRLQSRWIIARHGARIELQGEWITLTAMMVLFFAGFVLGAARDIAPELITQAGFILGFVCVVCLASGQFLGRALASLST